MPSDITVERSHAGLDNIRIAQDSDLIVVNDNRIGEFIDMVREYSPDTKEPEPSPHITAGEEELRTMRIVARINIQQKRRDVAYEEGRIAVLDSILGD